MLKAQSMSHISYTTLPQMFRERIISTPQTVAYRYFDKDNKVWQSLTWAEMGIQVVRWQVALAKENLAVGDRVAIMLRNCPQWVMFDQAALGLGLVTVPLYTNDRPDNVSYILAEAGVKLLLLEGNLQWKQLYPLREEFTGLQRIVAIQEVNDKTPSDSRLVNLDHWLPSEIAGELCSESYSSDQLASIVYTSGTTGRSKGVMLSHRNLLANAQYIVEAGKIGAADFSAEDLFLSFLPLSHTLERTAGYYLPMMLGATVAYSRSIQQLASDLTTLRPTVLVSVPRIYEQVYSKIQSQLEKNSKLAKPIFSLTVQIGWQHFEYQQGRAKWSPALLLWPLLNQWVATTVLNKLGGRLRLAISGGAALSPPLAKVFVGLGLNLLQGYGLTETSPVISVNLPNDNIPSSIGPPLPNVEVKLGDNNELLTRSECVMLGYWQNPTATAQFIDKEGWLHTGDQAKIDERGHFYITGRLKDIIVMDNGEKISPADMEMMITTDAWFEQAMVVGEGKPFLSALIVLNKERWTELAKNQEVDVTSPESLSAKTIHKIILARLTKQIKDFPGYAQIRRIILLLEPWTVENGLLTPSLKIKRARILEQYATQVAEMYQKF